MLSHIINAITFNKKIYKAMKSKKGIEVKYLLIDAEPRYWEDSKVNNIEDTDGTLIPCREGIYWKPIVDLDTNKIINWEVGKEAKIHYKVCDQGEYWLLDENKNKIKKAKGFYVPNFLNNGIGYGDYIILTINKDGFVEDLYIDLDEFED